MSRSARSGIVQERLLWDSTSTRRAAKPNGVYGALKRKTASYCSRAPCRESSWQTSIIRILLADLSSKESSWRTPVAKDPLGGLQ